MQRHNPGRRTHEAWLPNRTSANNAGFFLSLVLILLLGSGSLFALGVGDSAPLRTLPTSQGKKIDLATRAKAEKKRNLLLVFFRTGNCGICLHQLDEIQNSLEDIHKWNTSVAAVSLDDAITQKRVMEKITKYPILMDPDAKTVNAFGVFNPVEKLSFPSLFLIGPDSKILYSYVGKAISDRPPMHTLLEAVKHYSGLMPTQDNRALTTSP